MLWTPSKLRARFSCHQSVAAGSDTCSPNISNNLYSALHRATVTTLQSYLEALRLPGLLRHLPPLAASLPVPSEVTVWHLADGNDGSWSARVGRVRLKPDGTRWQREGKWRGNWRMGWVASTLTLPPNTVYPALIPLMRTPRLPAVDWTDVPADLNGLVRFGERQNLVSARVPSRFKRSLPLIGSLASSPKTVCFVVFHVACSFHMLIMEVFFRTIQTVIFVLLMFYIEEWSARKFHCCLCSMNNITSQANSWATRKARNKQDSQCTCDVAPRRVRVTIVVKKQ
jgi:hypothetical protein